MAIRWEKLTVKSQQAMEQAQARATELGNPEVQPVHLLLALIEDREGVIPSVLEKIGVPTERLEHDLHQIEEKLPRVAGCGEPARPEPGAQQGSRSGLSRGRELQGRVRFHGTSAAGRGALQGRRRRARRWWLWARRTRRF